MSAQQGVEAKIEKGWKPNHYLTNLSVSWFQPDDSFVAPGIFPMIPVAQSSGYFYEFTKADLARDNVAKKPQYGKVQPMLLGSKERPYKTQIEQVIVGLDAFDATDYERAEAAGAFDPRRGKVRVVTEQLKTHLDRRFAEKFFRAGVWGNEWAGVAAAPTGKQFKKFSDAAFDPIGFFDERALEMLQTGRRRPNVLALGAEAYAALRKNPAIVERVKYAGSTLNPATVNTNVLAQLFDLERVVVMRGTYNAAGVGGEDMRFSCDPAGALLCYAASQPCIDEPSAGYILGWDLAGDGNMIAIDQFEGEPGTHVEYVEGILACAMEKVCDELGLFMTDCV